MRRTILILALILAALALVATTRAQANLRSVLPPLTAGTEHGQTVDGIAARIEDDILTESEVSELAAFQTLVDGHSKSRDELIRELADQWIVRGEAAATKYPEPSSQDVDNAYAQLEKQFPSTEEFQKRSAAVGLTDAAVRRLLTQQLYLSRFLDYRFRPAAQVDEQQIAAYYKDDFAPQLQKRGQPVPAIEDVEDTIREVLIQRAINDRATSWLDETRERLRIDVMSEENKR
jgi:predicted exporter